MTRARVLVVEDDEDFQELYRKFFDIHAEEFTWSLAKTGDAAITAIMDTAQTFDVVLLDWHMNQGSKSGFDVLQAIRSNRVTKDMVAFMVTANEHERDIQTAIEAGADDYVNKPFSIDLLAARLRGRLNRRKQAVPVENKVLTLDGLSLAEETGIVELDGKRVDLYPTERALLAHFLKNPDRTLSPDQLWHAVRGYDSTTAGNALGQQVRNLRKKLGAWGDRIETLRGQGYLLNTRYAVSRD